MGSMNTDMLAEDTKAKETPADHATAVEGEIREFVRRDLAPWRRRRPEPPAEMPVENVTGLIQRVAGQSVTEIEHVIDQLQNVRDILRNEGERVQREIVGYANLSQAAMASMKIIADSMTQWKSTMVSARSDQG